MAKEATTTIDKALYEGLQQARKKKPRYYALIGKGADVVGLIVQKKAINDGLVQKAKAECKGNVIIQGVCHGEAVDIKFEVLEEPSIQPKKIKDFIDAQTELALKPQWVVVPQLTPVVDEEFQPAAAANAPAAVSAPAAAAPATAAPAPAVQESKPVAPAVDAKGLQARLMALLLRQKALVGKASALRDGLLTISKPAADLVLKASAAAPAELDRLEQALDGAEQWNEQFARVEPRYLEVLKTNPPDATKIRAVMAYCTEQAGAGAYDKAMAGLKRLEPLLDAATAPPTSATAAGGTPPTSAAAAAPRSTAPPAADLTPIANRWRAAREEVAAELEEFRQALLAEPEIATDPRFRFVQAASTEILNMLPPAAPVNAALAGGEPAAVLSAVQSYRKSLGGAAAFARLEKYTGENLGYKLEMRPMLTAALDEIESSLRNAP